jgi:4-hydroxy 2-oxovalerate aldolase
LQPVAKFMRVVDTTLRDGSHNVRHQFTPEQMQHIARALDDAGIDTIEIGHGDGLAGHSINYGFANAKDEEYISAVASVLTKTKLAVLLLPGIGTKRDLEMAYANGARVVRTATHCTEADVAQQHIGLAKKMGMEVLHFLMVAHMTDVETLVQNARLAESYGADCVYVVDSAGALLPNTTRERVRALKANLQVKIGFHAHNNLGCAMANTIAALEEGADVVDGSLRCMGAGGGNAPTEAVIGVLHKLGYETGVDFYKIMDAATLVDAFIPPAQPNAQLMLGYAGVYSSFYLHTLKAAEQFGLDPRRILEELGRRRVVGGQEDWIVDVAYEMSQHKLTVAP